MIIPIRCFTCNKVLADKWNWYQAKLKEDNDGTAHQQHHKAMTKDIDKNKADILESMGITKMCCKRHMLTHVDMTDYL